MIKIYTLLALIFYVQYSSAQQLLKNNYEPLTSSGAIPEEFINSVRAKFERYQSENIDNRDKRKIKRDKSEFLLSSSGQLDDVLKSGKVTFNNEISNYLNKIADKILATDNTLRNQVRIYPIGFETSNAFAFNEGALFIHIGLIARANSEAELAFIIGHEIGHYQKKHSIQRHIEAKKAERGEGDYKLVDENDKLKAVRKYSRENEIEADRYGFNLFSNSGYNSFAAVNALLNLNRTNSPPLSTHFSISLLEKGTYVIPAYYYENAKRSSSETNAESSDEIDAEDELATHPSLDERVDLLLSKLKVSDTINKPYFIISKSEFEYIRELCRMEMCRIYLLENKIDLAFYHINTMLQQYPDNLYLQRMMAITLARISEASYNSNLVSLIKSENKCAEELITSNYMLRKMHKEELFLLSIRYAWWVKSTNTSTNDIDRILKYTITNYTSKFPRELKDFAPPDSFSRSLVNSYYFIDTSVIITNANSKSKINKGRASLKYRYWFDRSLSRFALSDIMNNPEFAEFYNKTANENPDRMKTESEDEPSDEKIVNKNALITKSKKKVDAMNISSMIFVEPEFYIVDNRKNKQTDFLVNENAEYKLRSMIESTADKAGFKLTILAGNNFDNNDVQKFTDYGIIKDWFNEYFGDRKRTAVHVDYIKIKEIIKRYDSRYAALMVNVSSISNDHISFKLLTLAFTIIYFPLLPFGIYNLLPDKEYTMVLAIVDLEESKIVYGNSISFETADSRDLFKSQLYGILTTLKGNKSTRKGANS
jgi:Zn-dependent protease with chaperone function